MDFTIFSRINDGHRPVRFKQYQRNQSAQLERRGEGQNSVSIPTYEWNIIPTVIFKYKIIAISRYGGCSFLNSRLTV